jgi:hypothetical protein
MHGPRYREGVGKALIIVIAIVLLVYAFFDLLAIERAQVRVLPKTAWLVIVVVVPFIGPLAWILFGTARIRIPLPNPPRKDKRDPRGPDDDPDFLRGL